MIVYFETSALVKLLVGESGSSVAAGLWDKADHILTSRLTYPESRAAIAAAVRGGRASPASADAAKGRLEARWQQVEVIEVESAIAFAAGAIAERFALAGSDAVHLASAIGMSRPELVLATWDRRLARAAGAAGLGVAPSPA